MQNFQTHGEVKSTREVLVHLLMLKKLPVKIFFKFKLSAASYLNCVNLPLVDLDAMAIEIVAPMELDLLSGNTNKKNKIYKYLEKYLDSIDTNFSGKQWNQSLHYLRSELHGGQLKGGECSKNIRVLQDLLKALKLVKEEDISSLVNSLKCVKYVKVACLGYSLLLEYESTINDNKEA